MEGYLEGLSEGILLGSLEYLEGSSEGILLGSLEGCIEGSSEGILLGSLEGYIEGSSEGSPLGAVEGYLEGSSEGILLGSLEDSRSITTSANAKDVPFPVREISTVSPSRAENGNSYVARLLLVSALTSEPEL